MLKSNYVEIVGYQFERVHTGTIKWLLDSNCNSISLEEKYNTLARMYDVCGMKISFLANEVDSIRCYPEFSFGRKRKIDLVITIQLRNSKQQHIVIEMKVDSIPDIEQLKGTCVDFLREDGHDVDNTVFLLFLFGSSQVCTVPSHQDFHTFRLPEILKVFNNIVCDHYIYNDWIASLKEEATRGNFVLSHLKETSDLWDTDYWRKRGYRPLFSLFYYLYHQLKLLSKHADHWDIYSGSNNPIMNWRPGWLPMRTFNKPIQFYWEFNYDKLYLKVYLDTEQPLSQQELNNLRGKVVNLCNELPIKRGTATQKRYGTYNSIFKWEFDFLNTDFMYIIEETETILDNVHTSLKNL